MVFHSGLTIWKYECKASTILEVCYFQRSRRVEESKPGRNKKGRKVSFDIFSIFDSDRSQYHSSSVIFTRTPPYNKDSEFESEGLVGRLDDDYTHLFPNRSKLKTNETKNNSNSAYLPKTYNTHSIQLNLILHSIDYHGRGIETYKYQARDAGRILRWRNWNCNRLPIRSGKD